MKEHTCSNCDKHDWESNNHRLDHYCLENRPEFKDYKVFDANNYPCWKEKKPAK